MQAARGTSLSRDDSGHDTPAAAPSSARARLVMAAVFVTLYAVDQVTKVLAVRHLTDRPDEPLVGDLLQLNLVYNPGAAFGLGSGSTQVFSVVALVAALVVVVLARRVRSPFWALGFGLLLAGIVGNLTDRLVRDPGPLRGHVVDFLMLPNWPIFNVADICINAAAVAILIQAFRGVRLDGTRQPKDDQPEDQQ